MKIAQAAQRAGGLDYTAERISAKQRTRYEIEEK